MTNGRARPDVVAPARRSRRAGAWGAHLGSSDQDCHASLIPEEQRASSSVTAAAAPEFCAHPVGDRLGVIPDLRKPCEDAESTTAHSRGRFTKSSEEGPYGCVWESAWERVGADQAGRNLWVADDAWLSGTQGTLDTPVVSGRCGWERSLALLRMDSRSKSATASADRVSWRITCVRRSLQLWSRAPERTPVGGACRR